MCPRCQAGVKSIASPFEWGWQQLSLGGLELHSQLPVLGACLAPGKEQQSQGSGSG